jgi:hypothetical protein
MVESVRLLTGLIKRISTRGYDKGSAAPPS